MNLPISNLLHVDGLRPGWPTIVLGGLVVLLIAGRAGPIQAQSTAPLSIAESGKEAEKTVESGAGHWKPYFDEQIARALRHTPTGAARATLLRTLIGVALNEGKTLDYSETVGSLLYVLEHDSKPERRLLALQALDCLVPERVDVDLYREAMARVYTLAKEDSSTAVRRAGASIVRDFQSRLDGS